MQLKPCQCCSDQNRTIAISQSPPEVQLCVRTSEIRSKENNGLCHHKQDVGQVLSHLPILHISLCHTFDNIAKTPPGVRFEPKLKLFSQLKNPSYIFVRDLSATPTLCVFAHSRLWRKTMDEILDKYFCSILFQNIDVVMIRDQTALKKCKIGIGRLFSAIKVQSLEFAKTFPFRKLFVHKMLNLENKWMVLILHFWKVHFCRI